jgi:hypothetical protein
MKKRQPSHGLGEDSMGRRVHPQTLETARGNARRRSHFLGKKHSWLSDSQGVVESLNEPVSFKRWHTLGGQKQVLAKTKEKELKTTPATASGLMVGLWLSLNVLSFKLA